ncbi:hypothetical protein BO99DRAFT_433104 [Aspergillus violaceofuscus CBS 115571]|uniref:Nephrocystin 3-like N-terminal domain-containing protein n=1 Tax=Aspergillus violaceofuscus (strain CBS 115571) TaxID=1450538 RepID=A0A2V5IGY8_ASPV1|nr:hypothetical protein BO99DRAFT_433104 [Aspergillus violaceofuscus CBS 115571]
MDPFSAIGLIGNFFAFIEIGIQVVKHGKSIYHSAAGSSQQNQDLAATNSRFRQVVLCLQQQQQAAGGILRDDERALQDLCVECCSVSGELQGMLDALQARSGRNKHLQVAKVLWRDWRMKERKEALQTKLAGYESQLNLLLANSSRLDFRQRLDALVQDGHSSQAEMTSLQENVAALRRALTTAVVHETEVRDKIQSLVAMSDQASLSVRSSLILDALRFEGMHERFNNVDAAHDATFTWLLGSHINASDKKLDHQNPKSQEALRERARRRFIGWLEEGDGIFHISGKPGSGKSTLMKYICQDKATEKHLKLWSTNKALVLAKFFFWKHGRTLQKSFRGLVRGLMHSILSQWLELIPLLFPKQWQAALSGLRPVIDDDHEVFAAFRKLRETDSVYLNHQIAILIGGIGEFEGDRVQTITGYLKQGDSLRNPSKYDSTISTASLSVRSRSPVGMEGEDKHPPRSRYQRATLKVTYSLWSLELRDETLLAQGSRWLTCLTEKFGARISLRQLPEVLFPAQFLTALQELVDWHLAHETLTSEQLVEMRELFGPKVQPLLTLEAIEELYREEHSG